MAVFEVVKETTLAFGENAYVEVARKRLKDGGQSVDFIILTRGFFAADGSKKWTRFVTLPDDAETRAWLVGGLSEV